jgi:hypothetical protein
MYAISIAIYGVLELLPDVRIILKGTLVYIRVRVLPGVPFLL